LNLKDLDFAPAFHLAGCGKLQMGDNLVRINLNQIAEIGQGGGGTQGFFCMKTIRLSLENVKKEWPPLPLHNAGIWILKIIISSNFLLLQIF
jgi:hypothetical protein